MRTEHHQVIRKILAGAAIALGLGLGAAAPAGADPSPAGTDTNPLSTDPNPFGTLGCSCRETAAAGSPAVNEEIDRGLREGLTASLPGLPPPAQPR